MKPEPFIFTEEHDISSRRAFTLIELLVVISIIAMLVAILLPALKSARASAQQVHCASNQRQFAIAYMLFTQDHAGMLCMPVSSYYGDKSPLGSLAIPEPAPFPVLMRSYLGDPKITFHTWSPISGNFRGGHGLLECPSNPNPMYYAMSPQQAMNQFPFLPNINTYYRSILGPAWLYESEIRKPSQIMLMMDSNSAGGYYSWGFTGNPAVWGEWHFDGMNQLFFDSHVGYTKKSALFDISQTAAVLAKPPWYAR